MVVQVLPTVFAHLPSPEKCLEGSPALWPSQPLLGGQNAEWLGKAESELMAYENHRGPARAVCCLGTVHPMWHLGNLRPYRWVNCLFSKSSPSQSFAPKRLLAHFIFVDILFFFLKYYFFLICVHQYLYACLCTMYVQCLLRPEEGIASSRTGVTFASCRVVLGTEFW